MAKYQITESQFFYPGMPLKQVGDTVELPDDHIPADHWLPLDDAGKAGIAAAKERLAKLNAKKAQPAEAKASPAAAAPSTKK